MYRHSDRVDKKEISLQMLQENFLFYPVVGLKTIVNSKNTITLKTQEL